MSPQPSLFDKPSRYPHRAGFKEATTSKAAADRIETSGKAKTLRVRVFELFENGWQGTADEAATVLGLSILAIRPRISELHKLGYLEHSGVRHTNDSGAYAHVWQLNPLYQRRAG